MSMWGPWSSVDWAKSTSRATRREAPSIVLSDQDAALFGVAPEYDRLIIAECLFCDAVRRIECIAQHMLDEHPEEFEKKSNEHRHSEALPIQPELTEVFGVEIVKNQLFSETHCLSESPGSFLETSFSKKKNGSRRRVKVSDVLVELPELDLPSTSSGIARTVALSFLKRPATRNALEPALKRKFSLEKDRKYDPNEHCGVVSEPNGKPCCYALGACKAHAVRHRRAVLGRRTSYDELVLEHRARATSSNGILPERTASEAASEGSVATGSPASSTASKNGQPVEVEVAAEVDSSNDAAGLGAETDVPALFDAAAEIELPAEVEHLSELGSFSEAELLTSMDFLADSELQIAVDMLPDPTVFSELELPQESGPPAEAQIPSPIGGGVLSEVELAHPDNLSAEIELCQRHETGPEAEIRSRFICETSPHSTTGGLLLEVDLAEETADEVEIVAEEVLTMADVPTTKTKALPHIVSAALRAADEMTRLTASNKVTSTCGELEAVNGPKDAEGPTVGNEVRGVGAESTAVDSPFLTGELPGTYEGGWGEADEGLADDLLTPVQQRSDTIGEDRPFLSCAGTDVPTEKTKVSGTRPAAALATSTDPLPSQVPADSSSPTGGSIASDDLRRLEESSLQIDSTTEDNFKANAQSRSSVFLNETVNRYAVIVDPSKNTLLSSLLFPSRYEAADGTQSERSLRSTSSSTDRFYSGQATDSVADNGADLRASKLRTLLMRGKARSRSQYYHRRTERASHESPGSSGTTASSSAESGEVVAIPFKKPHIHFMMHARANHLSRICRLAGQSLPEYLRVYLRRPQLADLRERQSSPMSVSDDLSEVLE